MLKCNNFNNYQEIEKYIDINFGKNIESLKTDWICSGGQLEKFLDRFQIRTTLRREINNKPPTCVTPGLIYKLIQTCFSLIKETIQEKLKQTLKENDLDIDDKYEELRDGFRSIETRRISLRRPSQFYKNVPSRLYEARKLSTVSETTRKSSSSISASKRVSNSGLDRMPPDRMRKRSSALTARSGSTLGVESQVSSDSMTTTALMYETIREEVWAREGIELSEALVKSVREFIESNSISNQDIDNMRKFEDILKYCSID